MDNYEGCFKVKKNILFGLCLIFVYSVVLFLTLIFRIQPFASVLVSASPIICVTFGLYMSEH